MLHARCRRAKKYPETADHGWLTGTRDLAIKRLNF